MKYNFKLPHSYQPEYALSDTWRLRSSTDEAVELKYICEAIQSFVDVLVGGGYQVLWKGTDEVPGFTRLDKPVINLSYAPVAGQAPADGRLTDVVAGIGIHEAGHTLLNNVRSGRSGRMSMSGNILEDAWLEYHWAQKSGVLGAYIERMRNYYKGDKEGQAKTRLAHPKPISRGEAESLWIFQCLFNIDTYEMVLWRTEKDAAPLKACLESLLSITIKALANLNKDSITYGNLVRAAEAALDIYERAVASQIQEWQQQHPPESAPPQPGGGTAGGELGAEPVDASFEDDGTEKDDDDGEGNSPTSEEDETGEEEGESKQQGGGSGAQEEHPDAHTHHPGSKQDQGCFPEREPVELKPSTCLDEIMTELPPELANKVWEAMEHDAEDVSDIAGVRGFISKRPAKSLPLSISSRHVEQVQQAFETRKVIATTRYPFQEQGRLCARTLPRFALGKSDLFEEEVTEDEVDVAFGLLIDISGSITTGSRYVRNPKTGAHEYKSGKGQWEVIMESCQLMVDAFKENELDLFILGYQGYNTVRIYEPGWEGLRLGEIHPSGGTPTVPGLRVLVDKMKRLAGHRRDKIIVSLTDGEPNSGGGADEVGRIVKDLEERGWKVIGIGICVPEAAMERQYSRYFCIDDVDELPVKLRKIVEKM